MTNILQILLDKYEENIWLGRLSSGRKDDIKTDPKVIGYESGLATDDTGFRLVWELY
jgi:hypothetical protein